MLTSDQLYEISRLIRNTLGSIPSGGISSTDISHWNTAYGWGNHASAGYALASSYIPYTGGTSNVNLGVHNLIVDTNSLFVDSVNHRVGIGTLTPSVLFDVNGVINATSLGLGGALSGAKYLSMPLSTNNSQAKFGNFEIQGYAINNAGFSDNIYFNGGNYIYRANGYGVNFWLYQGGFQVLTAPLGIAGDIATLTARLFVGNTGNVGIGNILPAYKLDVTGDIGFSGGLIKATAADLDAKLSGTVTERALRFITSTLGARIQAIGSTSSNLTLSTTASGIEQVRLTILEAGNVGIGTTTPIGKLFIGSYWRATYGGTALYVGAGAGVVSTSNLGITYSVSDASTVAPSVVGITLYNDDTTAGGWSPLLLFSKAESGATPYKGTMAGIAAKAPLGTGNSDSWIDGELHFYTSGAATSGLADRMVINKEGNVGIGTTNPTASLSVNEKTAINSDGGLMVKLTNRTGSNTVKGTIVSADLSNEEAFYTTPIDGDMPIGIVYEAGVANGSAAWIVVSGVAEVLFKNTVAPVRGYVAFVSDTAGRADISAAVPAALTHWREIGHPIQTKTAGTNVLAKVVLHFN